jgi:HD-GYP domain-containing protein (c-di-GMP phosphodiesterase class II)/DNA-binding CsgD family transcriptional regulator
MGFSEQIQLALRHLYERWDGKGMPGELRGEQVPLAVRLMHVAQDADMAWQRGGEPLAREVLTQRAGTGLDPRAVAAFFSLDRRAFAGWDAPSVWDEMMRAEPGPQPLVSEGQLDGCLSAMADFADLKSMFTVGHSRAVAGLAAQAADAAGLPDGDGVTLRRAALVHDLGRVAVPVYVWIKPGPLSRGEREQVRLHAYHSERVLQAAPGLRPLARLAGSHGERSDGSGYHRGSVAADLPMSAHLLAAADCYVAMREPRAYRPALSEPAAAQELSKEAEAGRLDPDAVQAVLAAARDRGGPGGSPLGSTAAGQPRQPSRRPAGLSERETEVLGLLALGLSTRDVAERLGISPKTCDNHIQHLYAKIGVSSRAGATLFALENGLVGSR